MIGNVLASASALFGAAAANPAVRRPVFSVDFGGSAASLLAIEVEHGLAPLVGSALLLGLEAEAGKRGALELGYEDSGTELVFSGQILNVGRRVVGARRVTAVSKACAAATLRINQSYEQQSAGDIVSDLAQRAGLATEAVEAGIDFPFYVVDDGRSVWAHIAALAEKCGFLAYVTARDELRFTPFEAGDPVQTFAFGADVLSFDLAERDPALSAKLEVVGEGAAGQQGSEAWSWLIKDPSPVSAESGSGSQRLRVDAALRSRDAAKQAADGRAAAQARALAAGTLLVAGAPAATVGSVVAVSGAPDAALDGKYLVRWLRHRYAKGAGFTSLLGVAKVGGGSAGPAGLLGAAGGLP